MIAFIDKLLNRVTMYRLALYYLIGLLGAALALSAAGVLDYDAYALLFSIGFLIAACQLTNLLFARTCGVPANVESAYITALILALIITPIQSLHDLWFLGWSAVLAMASKYILTIKGKHLFNPAALAVALTALTIDQTASWWVGSAPMLPFVLLGGLFLVRKLRHFDLLNSFLLGALASVLVFSLAERSNPVSALQTTLLLSPLLFFGFVILTEPLTAPSTHGWRMAYGVLAGVLVTPQFHLGRRYLTPELAILFCNALAYLVSPKAKLLLNLNQKIRIAPDIYDFTFAPARKLAFAPGQYMEWTLGHAEPDSRGNRRYFTLASSPTEDLLRVGVKFYPQTSSFKHALLNLDRQIEIVAAQIAGDFVLPDDPRQKCVLIAGGIGITPFRSMLKYLIDTRQRRPIVVFYSNRTPVEAVYGDVLLQAQWELGIKTVYTLTDTRTSPPGWNGYLGRISAQMIQAEVPDYRDCLFYISGPPEMVEAVKALLGQMQIKSSQIKIDYFAGLV